MEWLLFVENTCGENGLPKGGFYSKSTFGIFQNLHLRVSILLKSWPIQYLSSEDVYSHPAGPSEKVKRLSLLK